MPHVQLVSSDLNGTLVRQHTMADLIRYAFPDQPERFHEARRVFDQQTAGSRSIASAFSAAGPLTAGVSLAQAIDYARCEMEFLPGFESFLTCLERNDIPLVINTTGYDVTCRVIESLHGKKRLGGFICNRLEFAPEHRPQKPLEDDELTALVETYLTHADGAEKCRRIRSTGRIRLTIDAETAKMRHTRNLAATLGISPDRIAHVGDTMGDSAAIRSAAAGGGIGIAFNYNTELGLFVDGLMEGGRSAGRIFKVDPRGRQADLRHLIPILCPTPVG